MSIEDIEIITRCQCTRVSFKLKNNSKWFNVSDKSFRKMFNLKIIPDTHLPVFKCNRCIEVWKCDKDMVNERVNRVFLSWLD